MSVGRWSARRVVAAEQGGGKAGRPRAAVKATGKVGREWGGVEVRVEMGVEMGVEAAVEAGS